MSHISYIYWELISEGYVFITILRAGHYYYFTDEEVLEVLEPEDSVVVTNQGCCQVT